MSRGRSGVDGVGRCVWGGGGLELPAGGIHASQGTFSSYKITFMH